MTPKEKAVEICNKMYNQIEFMELASIHKDKIAIDCALICVEEMINNISEIEKDYHKGYFSHDISLLEQVKNELELL